MLVFARRLTGRPRAGWCSLASVMVGGRTWVASVGVDASWVSLVGVGLAALTVELWALAWALLVVVGAAGGVVADGQSVDVFLLSSFFRPDHTVDQSCGYCPVYLEG